MSSEERKKGDDTDDPSECNENVGMGDSSKRKMAPQLIISAVTSKKQDGNLTNSGANISTSEPHGQRYSDYYVVLNEVLDMTNLVNLNAISIYSADFSFLMNPNRDKKDRYIGIVSKIIEFPAKGIFSANQVRASGNLYDDNPRKLGGGGND